MLDLIVHKNFKKKVHISHMTQLCSTFDRFLDPKI